MNSSSIIEKLRVLPKERRDNLLKALTEKGLNLDHIRFIPKSLDKKSEFPLSPAQERLWVIERLEPGMATYNIPYAASLRGELDVAALMNACNEVVAQQPALRTVLCEQSGAIRQRVLESLQIDMPLIDKSQFPTEEEVPWLEVLLREEARKTFDLFEGPLIRFRLVRLNPVHHVLLITLHHIIADGWSMVVLIRSIADAYHAQLRKSTVTREGLILDYSDYVHWLPGYLSDERRVQQLTFWKEYLLDVPALHQLPTDFPRPKNPSFIGKRHYFVISKNTSSALEAFCKRYDCTLYTMLLSVFKVLIYRYSAERDICVGTPVAGRHYDYALEKVVGLFVNSLVIRTRFEKKVRFVDFLSQIKKSVIDTLSNQDVPFGSVVDIVRVSRKHNYSPIFQLMFALQNLPSASIEVGDLQIDTRPTSSNTAKFDLNMILTESEAGIEGYLEYDAGLFKAETVARMVDHYRVLIENILLTPELSLESIPMLSAFEQNQQLVEWNGPRRDYCFDTYLDELFIAQAARRPESIAVIDGGKLLSYRELYLRAVDLAAELQKQQVKPNQLVAVMLPRGWRQIVATMAVVMSGSAYLPINTDWPLARRKRLLELGETHVVLKQASIAEFHESAFHCIDVPDSFSEHKQRLQPVGRQTSDLAYVIFTSGSTGTPKGVAIEHRSIVNTLLDMNERFNVNEDDCVLALSELNFDLSTYDIFGTLAAGGRIVIPDVDKDREPAHWISLLERHNVSLWNSVPALLKMCVDYAERQNESGHFAVHLRNVWLSGDWIPPSLPDRLRRLQPNAEVTSLGGATEASIWSITYPVREESSALKSIPYGRALSNQEFYVLNEGLQLCPIGVAGDLYIGGVGLAQQYWRDKLRTDASFLIHPLWKKRLYRTGDRGRWLPNGQIEFLGREDSQVKVRGFRIELGEIESSLKRHPQVVDALVTVHRGHGDGEHLVAYIIPSEDGQTHHTSIHAYLQKELPEYMVPGYFMQLQAFPLSANGKVDRSALPQIDIEMHISKAYMAPRNQTETVIAGIWKNIMEIERIGIHDDFFELGGNSLIAVRLIGEIHEQLGNQIPVRAIFDHPTVEELSRFYEEEFHSKDQLKAV